MIKWILIYTTNEKQKIIYKEVKKFKELNENLYYRTDIGSDILNSEKN